MVAALAKEEQTVVREFLLRMGAPIYCEGGSGLREDPILQHLQVRTESAIWKLSEKNGYKIDGILRIGGIPVTRLWRDLEDRSNSLAQCSLSGVVYSGLSWGHHIKCDLNAFLPSFVIPTGWKCTDASSFRDADLQRQKQIGLLFDALPQSEPALYRALSEQIPQKSLVYLGNSLPVREWDLAATTEARAFNVAASRGLNGIDGQISTFLGLCTKEQDNWAILGDLTALYDFAGLWLVHALPHMPIKIIVINNGGGKLFARIYKDPIFQHIHDYDFEHFAKSWRLPYLRRDGSIQAEPLPQQALVEIRPDAAATDAFWDQYDAL
jgi:2-succinyl-5-enolpyruvyl-6-hydroxy-3-cyclohexene-1-carboxylate synthase